MREASAEKDLKRFLTNLGNQLDLIKRGYTTFSEAQLELVKQYPQMVNDELRRYQTAVLAYFSLQTEKKFLQEEKSQALKEADSQTSQIVKELVSTERGTKFYLTTSVTDSVNEDSQMLLRKLDNGSTRSVLTLKESQYEDNSSDILAFDELIPNTRENVLSGVDKTSYLKHSVIPFELIKNAKNL